MGVVVLSDTAIGVAVGLAEATTVGLEVTDPRSKGFPVTESGFGEGEGSPTVFTGSIAVAAVPRYHPKPATTATEARATLYTIAFLR